MARNVDDARRKYLGEAFLKFYPEEFKTLVEIVPEIIAARCLGIKYGDPGPRLPPEKCRQCWGERYVWLGNVWGIEHLGPSSVGGCACECHKGEIWLAGSE